MPTTEVQPTTGGPDTGDRTSVACAVCPHPMDAHDIIGTRYCSATASGGLDRGCVCNPHTHHDYRR
jgi:hypothetical protein